MTLDLTSNEAQTQRGMTIINSVLVTVAGCGDEGAPSGLMYAACMTVGMTLEQYEQMMATLVKAGFLRHSNNCYFYTGTFVPWTGEDK